MQELSVRYLKGIGPKRAEIFSSLGINTVEDLLYYFPRRYEDRRNLATISTLKEGQIQTIKARVLVKGERRSFRRRSFSITEMAVEDDTGKIFCVWFNQPYVSDSLTTGKGVRLSGKVSEDAKGLFFGSPAWELSSRTPTNTGRLVPIYPETDGLTSRWIRWQMQNFIKFALRNSHDFPVVSVAALLNVNRDRVDSVRIVLGAVAPIPLRIKDVEDFLKGKKLDKKSAATAAKIAVEQTLSLTKNKYKVQVTRALVERAFLNAR